MPPPYDSNRAPGDTYTISYLVVGRALPPGVGLAISPPATASAPNGSGVTVINGTGLEISADGNSLILEIQIASSFVFPPNYTTKTVPVTITFYGNDSIQARNRTFLIPVCQQV